MSEKELDDLDLAWEVVSRSPNVVTKLRYAIANLDQNPWVFDVFEGENEGLVIAEIEGHDVDSLARLPIPPWASKEVTSRQWYNNEWLALYPMRSRWKNDSAFRLRMLDDAESDDSSEDDPFS